ncbi:MAG TPA: SfnB family sulfur acquisition oxidoreductase [Trebonia sp.]|nr:SfnB family sulfur acquisition oxidoreductase [Trebonia sp.]
MTATLASTAASRSAAAGADGIISIHTAREAVDAARAYADSIRDGAIARDRRGEVPYAELAAFDASGLLSITVPRAYGGPGLGASVVAEVIRLIAAADPAIAQVPQAHYLFTDVLAAWGTPRQQERLFAEVLSGGRFGNGQAERGGAHAQDLKTTLRRDASGVLRLTGKKYYTTGSLSARWLGVTALGEDGRLALAFVRRDAAGITLDADWNVMGQRATVSGSAAFSDVPVDPELAVSYADAFAVPQQLGARTQLVHAAIQVGIAGGALADARWFVRDKARPFFEAARAGLAERASTDPHTLHRFGELAAKVAAAEALLRSAAQVQESVGRVPASAAEAARASIAIAQAKAFGSEVAAEVTSELFSLAGASAADEKYGLSRHWRNARTHASHDPVSWKYHHVGNYLLNDALPPNHGQF